ncbi:MAG: hypothetical protein GWO07_13370 [Candidatus Dadabacteria bacterium]|nr:hypothetical protein [Candidatus Dadabacteria bacterium]NIV40816.1 hypothetical protein [Candidatus Dadabacteria bacterium]NIX16171.1 hypothetical protein [Candidatus Dadabacteria bacterium]
MEKRENRKELRKKLVRLSLIFVAGYVLSLVLWLFIGKYYGYVITSISAYAIAPVKNIQLDKVEFDKKDKNNISTYFRTLKQFSKNIGMRQDVNYGHFTFNIPITIGILAAFFPFIRKKRVFVEVTVLLISIHIIYVFFLEGLKLSEALLRTGYEKPNEAKLIFWQYSEGFLKSMVLRFEPFLIGAYLYFSRTRGLDKPVANTEEHEDNGFDDNEETEKE